MPLAKIPPNTILLVGRERAYIDNNGQIPIIDTGALPGQFVELADIGGVLGWRKVTSATNIPSKFILLEDDINGKGVDQAYNSGDIPAIACLDLGMEVWALVPSGQDITQGDYLQQNGDGNLKEATAGTAAANVAHYQALETLGAITALTRCRTQIVVG